MLSKLVLVTCSCYSVTQSAQRNQRKQCSKISHVPSNFGGSSKKGAASELFWAWLLVNVWMATCCMRWNGMDCAIFTYSTARSTKFAHIRLLIQWKLKHSYRSGVTEMLAKRISWSTLLRISDKRGRHLVCLIYLFARPKLRPVVTFYTQLHAFPLAHSQTATFTLKSYCISTLEQREFQYETIQVI